jgi:hypothetical protein
MKKKRKSESIIKLHKKGGELNALEQACPNKKDLIEFLKYLNDGYTLHINKK